MLSSADVCVLCTPLSLCVHVCAPLSFNFLVCRHQLYCLGIGAAAYGGKVNWKTLRYIYICNVKNAAYTVAVGTPTQVAVVSVP